MSSEPTGFFDVLSRLVWGALVLMIALWFSVQILLQIWIYLVAIATLIVLAYSAFAYLRWRRWRS